MPRARRCALFPVAMSPARAADALGIRAAEMSDAIVLGDVPVYQKGARRFVLTEDLVRWVRETWPLARIKQHRSKQRSRRHV